MSDGVTGRDVAAPIRQPWRAFDERAREEFCTTIAEGARSIASAARIVMVNPATVCAWIKRGKRTDYGDDDFEYRRFYLHYLQAQEAQRAIPQRQLTRFALNAEKDADSVRAAVELARLQERRDLHEHAVEAAKAEARIARAKAELVEATVAAEKGRVEAQLRLEQAKADMAEAVAATARRKDQPVGFAIASAIADESIPEEVRRGLLQHAIERGYLLVKRADIPPPAAAEPTEDPP